MKKILNLLLLAFICGSFLILGCKDDDEVSAPEYEEVVAVANRASSNVSFINAVDNSIVKTLDIPNSEPMYANYVAATDKLYVGDRAQNQIHVIDPTTQTIETSITVGNGVFHMWVDGQGNQLWVNNDVDFTTSVIDLSTNTVIATIFLDSKPHDVFVNKAGTQAYVSVFSGDGAVPDSIFAFSTSAYERTAAVGVGKDPHLFHLDGRNKLYVPCQSGTVYVLDGSSLAEVTTIPLEGSHGVFASPDENYVYVANISGAELYTINPSDDTAGTGVAAPNGTPHNLAVNEAGTKLFVTHSGPMANTLTTYNLDNGGISSESTVDIGTNPFGLAYYKRQVE